MGSSRYMGPSVGIGATGGRCWGAERCGVREGAAETGGREGEQGRGVTERRWVR